MKRRLTGRACDRVSGGAQAVLCAPGYQPSLEVRDCAEQAHKEIVICTRAHYAHSFRAIGVTAYPDQIGARVEVVRYLADHANSETTRLHDCRAETISLDEIERIGI